jgi:hypothetical protein
MQVSQYVAPVPLYHQDEHKNTAETENTSVPSPVNERQQRSSSRNSDKDVKKQKGDRSTRSAGGSGAQSKLTAPVASASLAHHVVRRDAPPENPAPTVSSLRADGDSEGNSKSVDKIDIDPATITPDVRKEFHGLFDRTKSLTEQSPADVPSQASNYIRDTIKEKTGLDIDPDQTYVTRFSGAEALHDGTDGVTGWQHKASELKESVSLTDFFLQGADDQWLNSYSTTLNAYYGVYKADKDAKTYGANNEVKLLPSDLRSMFTGEGLEKYLIGKQSSFWASQKPLWRTMAKFEYSALAKKASVDGQLSRQGYEIAMQGAASNVALDKPASMKDMEAEANPDASVKVRRLDIDKYTATDILRMEGKDGRNVLYIPGSKQSFYEFKNEADLKKWVIDQTRDPVAREELASHFSAYDRSTGNWGVFSRSGINEALANLASGKWDAGSIDMENAAISGDAFSDMADRIRQRNEDDLTQISLKHETREIWLDNLHSGHTDSLTKPIARALSTGNFAELVGKEGGGAVAADTDFGREAISDASGMNGAATLLLAPQKSAAGSVRPQSASTASSNSSLPKQKDFSTIPFPPGNAVEAMNEFSEKIQAITGQANPVVFNSLSDVRNKSDFGKDKTRFERLQNSLDEVYKRLDDANKRLHDPNKKVDILASLILSLDTVDENALNQAYERLGNLASDAFERFKAIKENGYRDVTFFDRSDTSKPVPENEKQSPTFAFCNLKNRHKMAINLDAPDLGRSKVSDAEAGKRYNVELVDSIMNQLTRMSANTQDFMGAIKEQTKDGFALTSAKNALDQFKLSQPNDATCEQVLGKAPDVLDDAAARFVLGINSGAAVDDPMRSEALKAYNRWSAANKEQFASRIKWTYSDQDRQEVQKKIRNDDVARADLLTSNADTASLYLRDIGGWRGYDTPPGYDYFLDRARKNAPDGVSGDAIKRRAMEDFKSGTRHEFKAWTDYGSSREKGDPGWQVEDFNGEKHHFATKDEAESYYNQITAGEIFRRVGNPLGNLLELAAHNASFEKRQELRDWGNNPLGKTMAHIAKQEGKSETVQALMEVIGSTVEGAIPIWGQARAAADTVGGALANPIEGRPPELDSAISLTEMFKDGVTGNLGKGASFNGKTLHINVRLPNGKRVTATARMPKVGPETAVEAPRVSTSNTPTKATTASGRGNSLATRLKKIQTEGLGGKGGPQVAKKWGVEDAQKKSAYGGTPPRQSANGQTGATTAPQTQVKWKNFRVNRGGDALATTALAYKKFDQANFSVFRKRNPDGVCQGLSLEAIQRIDRGLAQGQDLSTTVLDIKKGLLKSSPDQKTLVTSISSKQQNPKLAAVRKLEPQPTRRYQGDRQTSINALENDLRSMAQNDVAVLRMKIKGKHGETLETGHMLVVQRTKDQQYQLFDSNNGVFTYANEDALRNGLDPYFDAAYSERGVMSPDSFTLYKSQPAAATVTPKAPESPDPQRPYGEHHDFPYIDADNVPERKTATVPTQTDSPGTRPAPSPVGGNTDLDIRLNVDNVNRALPGLTA